MSAIETILTPTTPITLGNKEFKLLYDFNAVAVVEEKTGKNLLSIETWKSINGTLLSVLLWAGLLAHQPELTLTQVRKMMNTKNVGYVSEKVQEAWVSSSEPEAGNAPLPIPEPAMGTISQ